MCLYEVTGRSGHVDRTLWSVPSLEPYWSRSDDGTQRSVNTDRTRPVVIFPLWNLTVVDRTLGLSVRSLHLSVSGRTR